MNEHIENNNIHLTPEERRNLNNLGVSVKFYGAIGDGNADDTSAFTTALENNKRVYVPGGIYKITGELVIYENCELELAQDAVLDFRSATDEVIPETFKCITLSSSSRLVGNYATIRVPYTFEGSVVCISANPEDDASCKRPRYLKDINIVKSIEQKSDNSVDSELVGQHAALDNQTNGTALLIEGTKPDETKNPSVLWGVEGLGIRIAGAFDYGIRCMNTNYGESGKTAWKYETSIDALIENCRTGIHMEHYNNARISAVVKTRQSYISVNNQADPRYAEYGIHLANCKYIDLRNSKIIDSDHETDDLTVSDEFKYINLVGNCCGLMISNSLCSEEDSSNVRDYIHTNIPENFDNMTVLGEPAPSFFELGDYGTSNLYKNHRINSKGVMTKEPGITSTDYITCKPGSTVILKDINIDFDDVEKRGNYRIVFYDKIINNTDEECLFYVSATGINYNDKAYIDFDKANSKFTINTSYGKTDLNGNDLEKMNEKISSIKYFRICCNSSGLAYNSSIETLIEVDNHITISKYVFKFGELKDGIRIEAQHIKGLEERIQEIKANH